MGEVKGQPRRVIPRNDIEGKGRLSQSEPNGANTGLAAIGQKVGISPADQSGALEVILFLSHPKPAYDIRKRLTVNGPMLWKNCDGRTFNIRCLGDPENGVAKF